MNNNPDDYLGPPPPRTLVGFGDPPLVRRSSSDANRPCDVIAEESFGDVGFLGRPTTGPRIYRPVEPTAVPSTSINRSQRIYYPLETNSPRAAGIGSYTSTATEGTGYDSFDFPAQPHISSAGDTSFAAPLPVQQPRSSRALRNGAMYRRAGPAGRFVGTAISSQPAKPTTASTADSVYDQFDAPQSKADAGQILGSALSPRAALPKATTVDSGYDEFDAPQSGSDTGRFSGTKLPSQAAAPTMTTVGSIYEQFDALPSDLGRGAAYDAFDALPVHQSKQTSPASPRVPCGSGRYSPVRDSRPRSTAGAYPATQSLLKAWLRNSQADRRYQQARRFERTSAVHSRQDITVDRGASEALANTVSSDGLVAEGGGAKDWNAAWQKALEMPEVGGSKRAARWERLARLSADFKATAENYTRVIVMERNLPDGQKTVKPIRGGGCGVAGGEKYLVAGMYIKFLIDHKGLYGSEEHAAKVGNHEIRGANVIFAASASLANDIVAPTSGEIPNAPLQAQTEPTAASAAGVGPIRVPLMVLVDFLGCRLLATSRLPVSRDTLVFGTDDAGGVFASEIPKPLHRGPSSATAAAVIGQMAKSMNLAEHFVADMRGALTAVSTCADLEGHRGRDGRLYVLDTARLMPAEAPKDESGAVRWPKVKAPHLVYQLRPKVVLQHPQPLSSDAWSRFGAHDASSHNAAVSAATQHLLDEVIPAFARGLLDRPPYARTSKSGDHVEDDDLVPRILHEAGINLRYMGHIYKLLHAKNAAPSTRDPTSNTYGAQWQELLLVEMVSRVVKHRIRRRCLAITSSRELSAEHEFRSAIVSEMNKALSKLPAAQTALWHPLHGLQAELRDRFGFYSHSKCMPSCLPTDPHQQTFDTSKVSGRRLFRRVTLAMGLYFLPAVYDQLASQDEKGEGALGFEVKRPLDVIDLQDARPVVKQMAVVAQAKAMLHYERALATQVSTNGANSNAGGRHDGPARLLRLAAGELRHALRSLPDDTAQRGRLAHVLVSLASRSFDREEALLSYSKAIDTLKSAVSIVRDRNRAVSQSSVSSEEPFSPVVGEGNEEDIASSTSRAAAEEVMKPRALVGGGTAGYSSVLALLEAALPNFSRWSRLQQLPHMPAIHVSSSRSGSAAPMPLNSTEDHSAAARASSQSAWMPPHSSLHSTSLRTEESISFTTPDGDRIRGGGHGSEGSSHSSENNNFSSSYAFNMDRSSSTSSSNSNIVSDADSSAERCEHEHVDRITAMYLEPLSMVLLTCGREIKAWELARPNTPTSTPQTRRGHSDETFPTAPHDSTLRSKSEQGLRSGVNLLENGSVRPLWLARTRFNDRAVAVHALGSGSNFGDGNEQTSLGYQKAGVCAVSSFDAYVSILDLASGALLRTLNLKADHASCLCLFRPILTHNADSFSPQSNSESLLLACGTAYRRLLVFDCSMNASECNSIDIISGGSGSSSGSGDSNKPVGSDRRNSKFGSNSRDYTTGSSADTSALWEAPLVASAMVAHGRALSLKFLCHGASNSTQRRHRVGSDGELDNGDDRSTSHSMKRQSRRRSSLDSSSSFDHTPFYSKSSHQDAKVPAAGSPVALVIGLTDGSVLHWHLGKLAASASASSAPPAPTSTSASSIAAIIFPTMERILISPSSLSSGQGPVTILAAPLLTAASAEEGVGAQVRLALVARLFDEVARGHLQSSTTGSSDSNQPTRSREKSIATESAVKLTAAASTPLASSPPQAPSALLETTRSSELLACADDLCEEVALIEAQAPTHETQSRNFESAVPGLRTFTARLKIAAAAPKLDRTIKDAFNGASSDDDDSNAAARMLAEFEVHLRHLLTFPSAQACKTLNLDLYRWEATHASMHGLGRRKLFPLPNGSSPTAGPNSTPRGTIMERPFVHSDLEPHPPVYQVTSDAAGDVLVSLGRDRLLRVWDLGTGTPLRALPVSSQDVPLTSANGVVACVVGERSRSFSVWATPSLPG